MTEPIFSGIRNSSLEWNSSFLTELLTPVWFQDTSGTSGPKTRKYRPPSSHTTSRHQNTRCMIKDAFLNSPVGLRKAHLEDPTAPVLQKRLGQWRGDSWRRISAQVPPEALNNERRSSQQTAVFISVRLSGFHLTTKCYFKFFFNSVFF